MAAVEPGASFFETLAPQRLCDTRARPSLPAGFGYVRLDANTIRVTVAGSGAIPTDGVAAVLTVTGVNRGTDNWLSVFPARGGFPGTSNVNFTPFDTAVANLVTVKLGAGGAVDILSYRDCDVIVDVAGIYRPTSVPVAAGRYQALDTVVRAIDTRSGGTPAPRSVVNVNLNGIVPANAVAVVANVTAVDALASGYVSAFPLGSSIPDTSSLNVAQGETRAVGVITKLGSVGGVTGFSLFTYEGAHLLVDVAGYITGPGAAVSEEGLFVPITPVRLLDTRQDKQRLWPGWTRAFTLPAPIATRAQAVAMNLTATRSGAWGYFTLYAAQTARGAVSNLNVNGPGQTIANHAICRISNTGVACYSHDSAHIICDVTGWYTGRPAAAVVPPPVDPPPPVAALPYVINVPSMGLNGWVYGGAPDPIVNRGNSWHWTGTGLAGGGASVVLFAHRTSAGGPYYYQHLLRGGNLMSVTTADGRRYTYRMQAEYLTGRNADEILWTASALGGETVSLVSCTRLDRLPTNTAYWMISTFTLVDWEDLG